MTDNYIYDFSLDSNESDKKPFVKKQQVYINDSNSGNYSSKQVTFETVSLSNNGRFCDYRNGYIILPLVMTVSGTDFIANDSIRQSDLMLCLKNNSLNFIDSLTLEYNNNSVVQISTKSNAYLNFKMLSEMSYQDELLNGPTLNHYNDTSDSWTYRDEISPKN
jgi:hypothetical protein